MLSILSKSFVYRMFYEKFTDAVSCYNMSGSNTVIEYYMELLQPELVNVRKQRTDLLTYLLTYLLIDAFCFRVK